MNIGKHSLIAYLLLLGIIVSSVLGCVFYTQTMMMEEHNGTTIAKCCEGSLLADIASHNPPSTLVSVGVSLLTLLVFFVVLASRKDLFNFTQSVEGYLRVWHRRGGPSLFNKFILIFSKGIIHPKVY